jgi:hypothetical protein
MLSGLLKRYDGDVHEALSAYNAGEPTATGTRTRWSDGSDLSYADSVLRHYQRLSGGPLPSAGASEESPQSSAIAESNATIASIGSLRAQAQRLPLPMVAFPSRPHAHSYQQQATNYVQLFNDDTDETNS